MSEKREKKREKRITFLQKPSQTIESASENMKSRERKYNEQQK